MSDATYNGQKVYRKQGAEEFVVSDGGKIKGESGGRMDFDDAFAFYFGTEALTGENLKAIMRGANVLTLTNQSTGATVLSDAGGSAAPVINSVYGIILFSCSNGMTNGSCRMYSGLAGQRVFLGFTNADGNAASLHIHGAGNNGFAGVTFRGKNGATLSTIALRQSAASWGWVKLLCVTSGVWAVVEAAANNVTEHLA